MNHVNSAGSHYRQMGESTKRSRRAKGLYATPTELATYRKTLARGGDSNLSADDIALLATCQWLPASVRTKYQQMAQAA